jgi:hypothetical protein
MTARRLTDAELALALRRTVPAVAAPGLRDRIASEVASTSQQRPVPSFLAVFGDADPVRRQRALLVAAALLVLLSISAALLVGTWLTRPQPDADLSLERPADLAAFVDSSYTRLAELPALAITTLEDGTVKARFLYDGVGVVRYEHYDDPDATTPQMYRLISREQVAEITQLASGESVWLVHGPSPEDPRLEIGMATGVSRFCEGDWAYVGLETVMGTPTHHLSCATEVWIDPVTRFVLRSRQNLVGEDGQPLPGQFRTLEVTAIEIGPQPAELFDLTPPAGLAVMTNEQYNCSFSPEDPACASPGPSTVPPTPLPSGPLIVLPPPAVAAPPPTDDAETIIARALASYDDLPAMDMLVAESESPVPGGSKWRYLFDGHGGVRSELMWDPTGEGPPTIFLQAGGHTYESYYQDDGSIIWHDWGERLVGASGSTLGLTERCAEGWVHVGVDLVLDRPADRLACGLFEVWIDREWLLVTRSQRNPDLLETQTRVQEVLDVQFVEHPAELFELPEDAVVRDSVPR